MRYAREKSSDWCEIKGAADLTMRQIITLWGMDSEAARALAASVCVDSHFANKRGATKVTDSDSILDLTPKQWDWLRDRIAEASRDEECDPEA